MTLKIKTPYNADQFPKYRESNFGPSQTVPDQTMSLKELLERYSRGLPIEGEQFPVYHGEEEPFPDLKKMDLTEIDELRSRLNDAIKEQQEAILQEQVQAQQAQLEAQNEAKIEAAIKKYIDEQKSQPTA